MNGSLFFGFSIFHYGCLISSNVATLAPSDAASPENTRTAALVALWQSIPTNLHLVAKRDIRRRPCCDIADVASHILQDIH